MNLNDCVDDRDDTGSERIQTFAFVDSDTAAYFEGVATPRMYLMTLSRQTASTSCVLTPVSAFTTAASAMLRGSPVAAATAVGDGVHVIVSAGAHLFVVSRSGDVADLGLVLAGSTGALLSLSSLMLSSPCGRIGTIAAITMMK
jgi:hypothetical protein